MALTVALPLAARAAEEAAHRLEASRGPSPASSALRRASDLARRQSLTGRRR